MHSATADVIVVGAGLTGALIAARLAEQGLRALVLEAYKAGSRQPLGVLTPDPQPAHFARTRQSSAQLRRIAEQAGALRRTCDVIHFAASPAPQRALDQLAQIASDVAPFSAPAALPAELGSALVVRHGAELDVDYLVVQLLRRPGISVRQHVEVLALESDEARGGVFVMCRRDTFFAPHVVLATNAYVGTLSPYLAESVRPVRGAAWTSHPLPSHALPMRQPMIFEGGQAALLPTDDGRIRAVAWLWQAQDLARDPLITLRDFLRRFGLGQPEQTSRWQTILTTTTADGAPLVGHLDTSRRVLYAVGLGIYGLAWAAAVADQIVALASQP
jgi:glycine/D-amino acid oxidase-like deaminating enzyme